LPLAQSVPREILIRGRRFPTRRLSAAGFLLYLARLSQRRIRSRNRAANREPASVQSAELDGRRPAFASRARRHANIRQCDRSVGGVFPTRLLSEPGFLLRCARQCAEIVRGDAAASSRELSTRPPIPMCFRVFITRKATAPRRLRPNPESHWALSLRNPVTDPDVLGRFYASQAFGQPDWSVTGSPPPGALLSTQRSFQEFATQRAANFDPRGTAPISGNAFYGTLRTLRIPN